MERTLFRLIRVFPYRCNECDHRFTIIPLEFIIHTKNN